MTENQGRQLDLTANALQVVAAMRARVAAVADEYGQGSPEHVEILESLVDALAGIIRLGGRITREDELSLLGVSFITYGVIFFPRRQDGQPDPLRGTWSVHS
jgi:hypothetical protein